MTNVRPAGAEPAGRVTCSWKEQIVSSIPRNTVNPRFEGRFSDLITGLAMQMNSLAALWEYMDPEDREVARAAVSDAADDLVPALDAMRRSGPKWCVSQTVDVQATSVCGHDHSEVTP